MTSNICTNAAGGKFVILHLSRKGVTRNRAAIQKMLHDGVTITVVRKGRR